MMMQTFWKLASALLGILFVGGVLLLIGLALYLHDKDQLEAEVQHAES